MSYVTRAVKKIPGVALLVLATSFIACGGSSASVTILDSDGNVGRYTSASTGADGLGLISYWDFTNKDLKVAHCSNVKCDSATITTLDSDGSVGWLTSTVIGADGLGLISYFD